MITELRIDDNAFKVYSLFLSRMENIDMLIHAI